MFRLTIEQELLAQAVIDNEIKAVKSIIEKENVNIDFDVYENIESKLIHVAVEIGNLEVIKILLSQNPQLNCFNDKGLTPLAIAAGSKRRDIAEALLNAGADVNAIGNFENPYLPRVSGITALHAAASKGDILMMELLLTHGANIQAIKVQTKNPDVKNDFNGSHFKSYNYSNQETALDIVRRMGFREAEALLNERGAKWANPGCCSIM